MSMKTRIVRALVLGLVVSLVASGVAMASEPAQPTAPTDDVPATFAFAQARNGERGAYDALLSGDWGDAPAEGAWFRLLNFTRDEGGHIRDGKGRDLATDVLRYEGPKYIGDGFDFSFAFGQYSIEDDESWVHRAVDVHFEAGTRDVVAVDEPSHAVIQVDTPISPLGGNATRTTQLNRTERMYATGHSGICVLDFPWQGQVLATDELVLDEACNLAGILGLPAGATFTVGGWEDVKGVRSLRFDYQRNEAEDGGDIWISMYSGIVFALPVEVENLQLWMAPGVSVPVMLSWIDSEDRTAKMALVGYEYGTALPVLPEPPGPAWGPMRTTAPRPWGLDDTGVDHPFPLSVAYEAARSDPTFSDLRDYLAAHPTAATWRADYQEIQEDLQHQSRWDFEVTDGESSLEIVATRTWYDAGGQSVPVDDFDADDNGFSMSFTDAYELPEFVPDRVPTVDSLWERWNVVAGNDAASPNTWGFAYVLSDDEVVVVTQAGNLREVHSSGFDPQPETLGVTQSVRLDASLVTFYNDDAAYFEKTQQTDTSSTGLAGTTVPPRSTTTLGFQTGKLSGLVPDPQQAAGAGVLGIIVGLVYYLWPAVKSGGLSGLFSRLSKPEVLEHPQRVRILQAIEANPGIHFQELLRTTGLANGALVHHVRKLESARAVVARKSSGYTCYFLHGIDRRDMDGAETARAPGAKAILETVRSRPGITSQETADLTGLAASTVAYHAQRLAQAGLVTTLREGRVLRLHPGRAAIPGDGNASAAGAAA